MKEHSEKKSEQEPPKQGQKKKLSEVREEKKKVKKTFPWKSLLFVLILGGTGAFYFHETQKYGGFKESPTGKYLTEIGVTHYAELASSQALLYTHKGVEWSKENLPIYYAEASRILDPYVKLVSDLFTIIRHAAKRAVQHFYAFFLETKPKVDAWLNENIPGLVEKCEKFYGEAKEFTVYYGSQAFEFTKDKLFVATEWAKTNVFVGKLSPENLQRLTLEAVNTTQEYVKSGYQWVVNQVNSVNSAH